MVTEIRLLADVENFEQEYFTELWEGYWVP